MENQQKFIKAILLILFIGSHSLPGISQNDNKFTLSGHIKDAASGEELISASLYVSSKEIGTVSNLYGFYSITLPSGDYEIVFSYLGYEDLKLNIKLDEDLRQDVELSSSENLISEIVISAEELDQNVTSTQMSVAKIDVEAVKKIPALFGEVDIIKAIQLLPGVKSIGEGTSGFYVRGGNADQNLVLLDEAPIYNASHMLGFFSSFNPDAIKDMQLYKGAISSRYGGRLSSVLDIRMKEGNSKKFGGSAGIGTMMSRLSLEAPLGDQGSFIVSGRRSYLDVVGKAFQAIKGDTSNQDSQFYFYDLNAKGNYRLGENDRLFLSGYFGRDVFKSGDFKMGYGNKTATLRYNHIFSPKLFSNLSLYYSDYDYSLGIVDEISDIDWAARLMEYSLKADLTAYLSPQHTLHFGLQSISHSLDPGNITVIENGELLSDFKIENAKSLENAIYVADEWEINDALKMEIGLRASSLHNLGPHEQYNFDSDYELTDTTQFKKGIYHSYYNLEPRLGIKYSLNKKQSIKASYNRTSQYIQQASNGNSATPFDVWFTSSPNVKPQLADQLALGYFRNFKDNSYEFSFEVYYKNFSDAIDFKERAQLLLNKNLEGELRFGTARAYGAEVMIKKDLGRLTGWLSYTYSKIEKKIEQINEGNWYNAKYDKPHDLSLVLSYELNKRISIGSNFVYSTGGAATFPTGKYVYKGQVIPVYSERNAERLPDYHRLDFSLTLQNKKNTNRNFKSQWVFGIYNAYDRRNALSIDFKQDQNNPSRTFAEKTAVFSIVPSVTYNAKF